MLAYSNDNLNAGVEVLGSVNDRNTFSVKNDEDNDAGLVYTYLEVPFSRYSFRLDHEQRSEKHISSVNIAVLMQNTILPL